METLIFAIADFLCQHGNLDLKTSLGRLWERKYGLLVPSDSECRHSIPSEYYSCSQYYLQNGSVLVCLIICRFAPAIFMSQLWKRSQFPSGRLFCSLLCFS